MDDYIDFVLGRNKPKKQSAQGASNAASGNTAKTRAKARFIKSELASAEKAIARLESSLSEIDGAMCEPDKAPRHLANVNMGELQMRRAEISEKLAKAEAEWLALGEQLETLAPA